MHHIFQDKHIIRAFHFSLQNIWFPGLSYSVVRLLSSSTSQLMISTESWLDPGFVLSLIRDSYTKDTAEWPASSCQILFTALAVGWRWTCFFFLYFIFAIPHQPGLALRLTYTLGWFGIQGNVSHLLFQDFFILKLVTHSYTRCCLFVKHCVGYEGYKDE